MSYADSNNNSNQDEELGRDTIFYDLALRGEVSANLVGFCRYLRMKGLYIGMGEQLDAICALQKLDIRDEDAFRITLRITLAKSKKEQDIFDKFFHPFWYVWDSAKNLNERFESKKEKASTTILDKRPQKKGFFSINDWLDNNKPTEESEATGYSPFENKSEKDFSTFKVDELSEIMRSIQELGKKMANKLSLRKIYSKKKGGINFRRTLRNSLRSGGEVLNLFYYKKRRKRLKLVLLCDVSKSMDLYSLFLIQFIYAFQFVFRRIETFVFSTSLYRITDILRNEDIQNVLEKLSLQVPNWSGGTKIGYSLEQFVENFGLKFVDRQTICIIISDGWDTGDLDLLVRSMSYLKKQSRKIIWLNPLKGSPVYEPSTKGMQSALPYIDTFSSAHNLNSLKNFASKLI